MSSADGDETSFPALKKAYAADNEELENAVTASKENLEDAECLF